MTREDFKRLYSSCRHTNTGSVRIGNIFLHIDRTKTVGHTVHWAGSEPTFRGFALWLLSSADRGHVTFIPQRRTMLDLAKKAAPIPLP